ncbi:hypothetical protein [Chitinophaga solisilvae]|uniref:hypothetical protein n=1 Tax=Chitinophaga solisilvae TaxID=1233460 RepID=UPI0013722480|nr:hypothetical protein [Chitinophaga solisilvae]
MKQVLILSLLIVLGTSCTAPRYANGRAVNFLRITLGDIDTTRAGKEKVALHFTIENTGGEPVFLSDPTAARNTEIVLYRESSLQTARKSAMQPDSLRQTLLQPHKAVSFVFEQPLNNVYSGFQAKDALWSLQIFYRGAVSDPAGIQRYINESVKSDIVYFRY